MPCRLQAHYPYKNRVPDLSEAREQGKRVPKLKGSKEKEVWLEERGAAEEGQAEKNEVGISYI